MDSALTFRESWRRSTNRAREEEAALRRLVTGHGLPPASARNLQQVIVSGTLLYASEPTWNGSRKMERDTQLILNRMGRASLGVRRTTPLGIVAAESSLTPARPLLDHAQARFALRLMSRPRGGGGQEEILEKRSSALTARVRERSGLGRRETVEVQRWDVLRAFQGKVFVESKEEALATAMGWSDQQGTVWTDGSRMENGQVGAAAVWWEAGKWRGSGTFLGSNKEVFDAEVFAILQALRLIDSRGEFGKEYTIFSDSQAAIARAQHTDCGPAQALASAAVDLSHQISARGCSVSLRWTPAHQGVEGNEQADARARRAAERREEQADPDFLRETSLSHLTRISTEKRATQTGQWIREHVGRRHRYCPPPGGKMRKELGKVQKERAGRFYQLLSGHAATAPHLQRFGQAPNDRCWWCGSGERQTRYRLFVRCRRWTPEIRRLWQSIERECGPRAPSVRFLFRDPGATAAVLDFLRDTRVGKMPGLALYGFEGRVGAGRDRVSGPE